MSQNMCSISYHGLNMPQVNITEQYVVQFLQTFIFLVGLLLNSNYYNKEIKIHSMT